MVDHPETPPAPDAKAPQRGRKSQKQRRPDPSDLPPHIASTPEGKKRFSYTALKAQIRQEYETTDASIRGLATRFGLRSETSIRKWRDQEGWKKDVTAISAGLVTRAMAGGLPTPHTPFTIDGTAHEVEKVHPTVARQVEALQPPGSPPLGSAHAELLQNDKTSASARRTQGRAQERAPHSSVADVAQTPTSARAQAGDAREEQAIRLSRSLADIQASALRRHVAVTEQMMQIATQVMAQISLAITPLPPGATEEMQAAQAQAVLGLTSISRDKETLAGLMKSASSVLQAGIAMQRKSLGMEPDARHTDRGMRDFQQPAQTPSPSALAHVPSELLARLRDITLAQTRVRPLPGVAQRSDIERALSEDAEDMSILHEPDIGGEPEDDNAGAP